ncbi:MAG: hypothetical protein QOI95_1349 [Acidimicrobiaceae bacterium]
MTRFRKCFVAGVLVCVAAVSACGGGSSKPSAASTSSAGATSATSGGATGTASIDPCKLSESEMSAIVGFTVETKKPDGSGFGCQYQAGAKIVGVSINASQSEDDSLPVMRSQFGEVTPISGTPHAYEIKKLGEVVLFSGKNMIIVLGVPTDVATKIALKYAG